MKLEEYKKRRSHKRILPSGLEVEVRRLNPYILLEIQEQLKINFSDENVYTSKLIEMLLEKYLINPKIPKDIKISEFEKKDYEELHRLAFEEVTFEEKENKKK